MKKGISLSVLSVIIVIMVILTTTVTTTGSMALSNSKKMKFASEIAFVQEMVDKYINDKSDYPTNNIVEVDLSNVTANSIVQFDDEIKNGNVITLYELDFSLLGKTDLIYGTKEDAKDIYALSKDTGRVYYIKGLKVRDITYYTLTEDLKESIGYVSNVGAISKDGIIFNLSKNTWTNQNIDSSIKVPNKSEYANVIVSVIQNNAVIKNVDLSETTKEYYVYEISGVTGNYDVEVSYTKNSKSSLQTFNVTNYDGISPTLTVNEVKEMVNESDGIKQTYISIDIANDISGIKHAKYETVNILEENAKQYFAGNGMQILNNTIIADKYTKYVTIYVEDNAGNYTMSTVTLNTVLSTNDYVKENLVLQYDGINNTGNGHSNTATVWKDLSKSGNDVTLNTDNSFNENSCVFPKTINSGLSLANPLKAGINNGFTIECVAKSNTTNTSETEDFKLYDWFWNIRDDATEENYMQFIRRYTGEYSIGITTDSTQRLWDLIPQDGVVISQLVVNNSTMCNYYNGVLTSQENCSSEILNNMANINILDLGAGKWSAGGEDIYLNGNIYSFRVYNRALTKNEIKQNYKIDKIRYEL